VIIKGMLFKEVTYSDYNEGKEEEKSKFGYE
jgi:hypothetical protein